MSPSSGSSDELVEEGYRRANDSITSMFTRALKRDPAVDLGDVLQRALRRYPSLRSKAEERPQKIRHKGMVPLDFFGAYV